MTEVTLGQIMMAGLSGPRIAAIFMEYARAVNETGAAVPVAGEEISAGEQLLSYYDEIGTRIGRNPALAESAAFKPIWDATSRGMAGPEAIARAVKDLKPA